MLGSFSCAASPGSHLLSALKNNGSFISFGPITLSNIRYFAMDFTLGLLTFWSYHGPTRTNSSWPIVVAGIGVPLNPSPSPGCISLVSRFLSAPGDIPASVVMGFNVGSGADPMRPWTYGSHDHRHHHFRVPLGFDIRTSAGPLSIPIIDIPAAPELRELDPDAVVRDNACCRRQIGHRQQVQACRACSADRRGVTGGDTLGAGQCRHPGLRCVNSGTAITRLFSVSTLDATTRRYDVSGFSNLGDHMSGVSIDG